MTLAQGLDICVALIDSQVENQQGATLGAATLSSPPPASSKAPHCPVPTLRPLPLLQT